MPKRLKEYLDFLELEGPDNINLPLFHVCTQDKLMDYLSERKIIESKECEVFQKKIIYTFYGASKYKGKEITKVGSVGDRSVCLILDIEHCPNIISIYPLDTGVASGTVEDIRPYPIKWDRIKGKMNLGNQKSRINAFILNCFMTLEDYIDGKYLKALIDETKLNSKFDAPSDVSQFSDMHKIITDQSIGDNRRYCFEVHFDCELEIKPQLVKGVIVSSDLLLNKSFKALLEKYRVDETVGGNSLFYPSSVESNYDIEEFMKDISIKFTKSILAN